MNKFQLQALATHDLSALRNAITAELKSRNVCYKREKRRAFIKALSTQPFESLKALNAKIHDWNSAQFLAPPGLRKTRKQNLSAYLPALIRQDWSHLYQPTASEERFYVYAHVDPRHAVFVTDKDSGGNFGGMPFYIGKGVGNRAFDLKRNQGHGKMLREIADAGYGTDDIVKILFDGLEEWKAFELEAKLIFFFGTIYQSNDEYGCLLNLDIPSYPAPTGVMEKVITSRQWKDGVRSLDRVEIAEKREDCQRRIEKKEARQNAQ